MKPLLLPLLFLVALLAACGSVPDDESLEVVPAPAPVSSTATDLRLAEMQVLLSELLDRLEVMNSRIQRLEAGASPAPAPLPAAEPQPRVTTAPGTATTRPVRVTPPAPAAIGDRYREAITLFGRGRIDDARAAFTSIIDGDPSGDLADNALYWIGETHFVQANYTESIAIYRRLIADYGEQNKAPDAMLKMGLAYARLGDLAMARTTFLDLVQRYPYSTPAATARHELEKLKY